MASMARANAVAARRSLLAVRNPSCRTGAAAATRRYPAKYSAIRPSHCLAPLVACPLLPLAERVTVTNCEAALAQPELQLQRRMTATAKKYASKADDATLWKRLKRIRRRARRALRMLARAAQLLLTMAPLAALYPVARILKSLGFDGRQDLEEAVNGSSKPSDSSVTEWYLNLCLWCAESSGAAVIKLMQWASSRPDMFGQSFCDVFSRLQDSTTPHSWKHTEKILRKAYGAEWETTIHIGDILGSGCIGQVYAGKVEDANGKERKVAVKVMHPGVKNNIDADLDLLYLFADVAEHLPFGVGKQLIWLDLPGVVDEFHRLLIHQLDFRTEAENLMRFNENFKNEADIVFPQLVPGFDPQEDILIESFCDGLPFAKWFELNVENAEKRKKMCDIGIKTVVEMIFCHNFIHGDLHPGNIFVSPDGEKFILLDTGMAFEYTEDDHDRIVSILTAFIRMDGQKAGELLIKDSNARTRDDDKVMHEAEYTAKIGALTDEFKRNPDTYLMRELGSYIGHIFDAAQTHHVMMNPAFVSCALAVKVVEGVALSLDPNCEIWRVANPVILQAELMRNAAKVSKKFGVDGVVKKVVGAYYALVYANKKKNNASMKPQ